MKNLILVFFISMFIVSCSVYKPKVYTQVKPMSYSQHTTSSFPSGKDYDNTKMSDFEIAIINSWDDFTDEQKEFFKNALITKQKADSLIFNKN
jgi:hypothetical protein